MAEEIDLRATFVDECEDLLSDISEGLCLLEADPADTETIHSVFRAVHSIKGSAGAFKMEDVVRFAHTFETALDKIRNGQCDLDVSKVIVLQRSGDCLADALDAAFAETEHDAAFSEEMGAALKQTFDIEEQEEGATEFSAQPLDLGGFAPVAASVPLDLDGPGGLAPLDPPGDLAADMDIPPNAGGFFALPEPEEPAMTDESRDLEGNSENAPNPEILFSSKRQVEPEAEPDDNAASSASIAAPAPLAPPAKLEAEKKPAKRTAAKTSTATLRVDADRIDLLINTVGELIINQSTILERFRSIEPKSDSAIDVALDEYRQLTSELQERVLAIRAQPVKSLFQRMSRVVREVSNTSGKPARLVTRGDDTEVDKTLVESLAEPLTHMIRNSVDHGLESAQDRIAAGKSDVGEVRLSAYHASGNVVVEIADDGAGLNRAKIKDIAIKKGLVSADADLSTAEIDRLLFMPGFSTADKVSDLSGRGVGMDVVKNAINKLGGTISTSSVPGQGTKFKVAVPLTLAVMDGMIVRVGAETMVLPISCVVETVKTTEHLTENYGRTKRVFRFRDQYLPIIPVSSAMNLPPDRRVKTATSLLVIVKLKDDALVAFELDGVLDRRQLVIKGLETNCGDIIGVSAAAVLGDGKLVLIIDPDALVEAQGNLLAQAVPAALAAGTSDWPAAVTSDQDNPDPMTPQPGAIEPAGTPMENAHAG